MVPSFARTQIVIEQSHRRCPRQSQSGPWQLREGVEDMVWRGAKSGHAAVADSSQADGSIYLRPCLGRVGADDLCAEPGPWRERPRRSASRADAGCRKIACRSAFCRTPMTPLEYEIFQDPCRFLRSRSSRDAGCNRNSPADRPSPHRTPRRFRISRRPAR